MISWPKDTSEGDLERLRAISTLCRHCPSLIEFLFKPNKPEMWSVPDDIINRSGAFSGGEQTLVRIACDIWFYPFTQNYGQIMDAVRRLDDNNFKAVIDALLIARKI